MTKKDYEKKYKTIYKEIPESNKKKAEELIGRLADVLVMMDECQEHILEDGCVTSMIQGTYSIDRENPWSKVYDQKVKVCISLLDRLDKMLPDAKTDAVSKAGESLAQFVAKGKKIELR